MNPNNETSPLKSAGFGLIEIMIAMALGIVIILGITTLFADTSKSLASVDRSGRQIENALFTLELLGWPDVADVDAVVAVGGRGGGNANVVLGVGVGGC